MVREVSTSELNSFLISVSSNPFARYIGYDDGEICGYIEYNDIYDTIDIVNVFVLSLYRKKGIGFSLLNELISIAIRDKKKNITLEVSSLNSEAISLYTKCGFKKVALRKGYYKGIDGFLMELIL